MKLLSYSLTGEGKRGSMFSREAMKMLQYVWLRGDEMQNACLLKEELRERERETERDEGCFNQACSIK